MPLQSTRSMHLMMKGFETDDARVECYTEARSAALMCHIRGSLRFAKPNRACTVIIGLESSLSCITSCKARQGKAGRDGGTMGRLKEVKESDVMTE